MLANFQPGDGDLLLKGLMLLVVLLQTASLIRIWFPQRRDIPQPIEVKNATTFANRHDLESHIHHNTREHEQLFAKLGGVERGMRDEMKRDTVVIHEKINGVDRKVAGLEVATQSQNGVLAQQNQVLAQMSAKLDRLVERK